jgi:hypothetical protein
METTQGISLYIYLYLKLAKIPYFSYYLSCFSSTKLGTEGRDRFRVGLVWQGEVVGKGVGG